MSSVVSDFIFGPALRQVRRFSLSSITSSSESRPSLPLRTKQESTPSQENAICETDEDVDLRDKGRLTASQPPPSRSPVPPAMASEYDATTAPDVATASLRAIASMGPRPHQPEPGNALVETPESPGPSMTGPTPAGDTLAAPAAPRPDSRSPLPEDDGMGVLRARILEIQAQNLPAPDQARLVHQLLMENYTKCNTAAPSDQPLSSSRPVSWEQRQSQSMLDSFKFWQNPLGEAATPKTFVLTDADVKPVFAPLKPEEEDSEFRALGCPHYKRNVKSQCSSCSRWYTCRFCHDEAEDHAMVAKDTKNMLCMFCGTAQAAGEACVSCGESAAMYYCATCKLWNNDPDKPIYHCVDCGICRVGRGIGKDFFHCKKCCACLAISLEMDHRCIERSLDSDCPICGEYLHSSPKPVCIMKCGHAMHRNCYGEHIKTAYKCPICNKSVVNMETQFRNLDLAIEAQPMPEKFQDTRAVVLCNDCSTKTTVRYHWLGLRCAVCQSYNTSELQILGMNAAPTGEPPLPPHHTNNMVAANAAQSTTARDIPRRRRHSSNLVPQSNEALEAQAQLIGSYMLQERLARSVSPSRAAEQMLRHGGHHDEAEDSEDEAEDLIGFWRRVPRSITSPGILAEESESESESDDDSTSSIDDDMDDDGDDDDDDGINLLGHR